MNPETSTPGVRAVPSRAVFLDRDGTLNRDVGFPHRIQDLVLLPGVPEGLQRLQALGLQLVVATNQSGVARGFFGPSDVERFHRRLVEALAAQGVRLDALYWCPHHPEGSVAAFARDCDCRKPAAGLLKRAARDLHLDLARCFLIGDSERDAEAGRRAGCTTILIRPGVQGPAPWADHVVGNFLDAARRVEAIEGGPAAPRRPRGA